MKGVLALKSGFWTTGELFGAAEESAGEVVFNTAHTGYPQVITDPSYLGQIVTFTYPMIGNYGVQADELESPKVHASGVVVRQLFRPSLHPKASSTFAEFLEAQGVPGLSGVDTRMLTRHLREYGSLMGILAPAEREEDVAGVVQRARVLEGLEGKDLVKQVLMGSKVELFRAQTRQDNAEATRGLVLLCDLGAKHGIVRDWLSLGFDVLAYPGVPDWDVVRVHKPTLVCLSNGPGDPAALTGEVERVRSFLGKVPVFGICMGHQLLALALGGRTQKLKFGHHGVNHPVVELETRRVVITSQNHCYTIVPESLPKHVRVTYTSLYDGTIEGMEVLDMGLQSVQFHPEASPGPLDPKFVYRRFLGAIHA
jgi:carbamoyl-phosphate synthase small subunit